MKSPRQAQDADEQNNMWKHEIIPAAKERTWLDRLCGRLHSGRDHTQPRDGKGLFQTVDSGNYFLPIDLGVQAHAAVVRVQRVRRLDSVRDSAAARVLTGGLVRT
jgi:hypothetical protein